MNILFADKATFNYELHPFDSLGADGFDLSLDGWAGLGDDNAYYDDLTFDFGDDQFTLFSNEDTITINSVFGDVYNSWDDFDSGYETDYYRPTAQFYDSLSFFGSASNHASPLSFDLDGDGIETTHIYDDARVYFDIDNDGFAERVGWIDSDDGQLALDRNGNGQIDNITELFGDYRMSAWDELRLLDSNEDGVINSDDEKFEDLQVWRDLNQGEFKAFQSYTHLN